MSSDLKPFLNLTASVDENGSIVLTHSPISDEQRVLSIFAIDKFLTELTGRLPMVSIAAGRPVQQDMEREIDEDDLPPDAPSEPTGRRARWKDARGL